MQLRFSKGTNSLCLNSPYTYHPLREICFFSHTTTTTNSRFSQLTATSISLTLWTNTFLNESDDPVPLDTPKHSFPKEHHRDTNSFCSIASREASWKTPIWIVRPQSYGIANLNFSTSVQPSCLESPRKVSRRVWTCNLEPIIIPCFRRASVYHEHKQINSYC